jgi:uncharacterized DUF497 family protein
MQFEWDETKRASNVAKHGIDFISAVELFDGRPAVTFRSTYPAKSVSSRPALFVIAS